MRTTRLRRTKHLCLISQPVEWTGARCGAIETRSGSKPQRAPVRSMGVRQRLQTNKRSATKEVTLTAVRKSSEQLGVYPPKPTIAHTKHMVPRERCSHHLRNHFIHRSPHQST